MSDKTSEELRAEIAKLDSKLNEALEEIKKLNEKILSLEKQNHSNDLLESLGSFSRWQED